MYKEKSMLLTKIAEGLNANGWSDKEKVPFNPETGLVSQLGALPEENLQKILDMGFDYPYFDYLYHEWGKAGCFKMEPYIVEAEDVTYAIRHNKYLGLSSNDYFCSKGFLNADTELTSGAFRVSFLKDSSLPYALQKDSLLAYTLWWAAAIDAWFQFDAFRAQSYKKPEQIEQFMCCCFYRNLGYLFGYSITDIMELLTVTDGHIDTFARRVSQIYIGGKVQAILAVGYNTIQVETHTGKLTTLRVPGILEGTEFSYRPDEEAMRSAAKVYQSANYLGMLASMTLNLAGIHVSDNSAYWINNERNGEISPIVYSIRSMYDLRRAPKDNM